MRRLLAVCAAAGLATLLVAAPVGAASGPTMVKDIRPSGASNPTWLTTVGSTLFFAANDGAHGNELWKSDGTSAGTKMVKNIRPLAKSSDPQDLTNVNGTLFFTANDGAHGRELWKSDGTAAGTKMVKDVVPQCSGGYGCIGGLEIWIPPVAIGSRLFFFNGYCCVGLGSLYVSDGTAAGTKQLKANLPISTTVGGAAAYQGNLYFVAYTEYGHATLWVSNGTRAGTRQAGLGVGDDVVILPASGANLYFCTYDSYDTETLIQLFKTNGTAAGTKPLGAENALVDVPAEAALMASRLYFSDGPGGSLWKTDGTSAGTKAISAGRAEYLTVLGGKLYFARNLTLWQTDGTPGGTVAVAGFAGPAPSNLEALGSSLFFVADDGLHGMELWSYTP